MKNDFLNFGWKEQQEKNQNLICSAKYMKTKVTSSILPVFFNVGKVKKLNTTQTLQLDGISTEASRIAIRSLASLAKINELDHLGGALDLIPALMVTLAVTDYERISYTIENAHTSIGYFSCLAALGFLDENIVIDGFRRGLDITGHVSWVPGGTELNGGRLGIMIPAAVGLALGRKAIKGKGSWVICHCGDAGWISGQALNGFNAADLHKAPITFVMHRNGIQLSGSNKSIMDKDPRPVIESLGIKIIEVPTIMESDVVYKAYHKAFLMAQDGLPSLIYPTGYRSERGKMVTLNTFARKYGIEKEVSEFASKHKVKMNTEIWIPGALMSFRDVIPMIECLFLVNQLEGGAGHHDGHMKGRDLKSVLSNPMFKEPNKQQAALKRLRKKPRIRKVTHARPLPGSPNLILSKEAINAVELPPVGKSVSPRVGTQEGYAAVAKAYPENVFVVSCDLDASTRLEKARKFLKKDHQFEMSIEEQASAIMANGLAVSSRKPQLNVFSTFTAFFEGIAREGFEMWRYQRNLNGVNEGLNVCMHLSHVGSCTGRDHFSGWGLDWINLAIGYLPYLHRFYAPADARAAFLAVRDLAAHYGGHIIGVPRDNLPILDKQDGSGALWDADTQWEDVTLYRTSYNAKKAVFAFGAPTFLAEEAWKKLNEDGVLVDVHIINGLPIPENKLIAFIEQYPEGIITIEDGIIGCLKTGIRGFAGIIKSAASGLGIRTAHIGIVDPRVAPSHGHMETWSYFGITSQAIVNAIKSL